MWKKLVLIEHEYNSGYISRYRSYKYNEKYNSDVENHYEPELSELSNQSLISQQAAYWNSNIGQSTIKKVEIHVDGFKIFRWEKGKSGCSGCDFCQKSHFFDGTEVHKL